jgi:CO/xanthine dehydrogenase Mo-binding subunit
VEGPAKVTGRAQYAADITLPGIVWGRCLRSPFPHARILSIDTSRARQLPGVHAVITAADLPDVRIGRRLWDVPVLARDRVRFTGEKVAAVAAETPEIAEEALLLIDVEYEELPAVFDPLEALNEGAPVLHPDRASYRGIADPLPPIANVPARTVHAHGDIEAGFAEAARTFEHTFVVPSVHHGYIEPHACAVEIGPDGKIDIWLSNKTPFVMRGLFAAAIDVPEERVRMNPVYIGGDFGGKGSLMDAVVCYYLAERAGRPVKMVMNYTEELMAANPRHAAVMTFRTGVTEDGRITARQARLLFNSGAYGGFTPLLPLHGYVHAGGPYRVPNIEIEAFHAYTNTVPAGHMRSPGGPQVVFALESHMDMVAHELGLDPLEFRLRNVLVDGDTAPTGQHWKDIRAKETLEAAAKAIGWRSEKPANVGRGIAMYDREPGFLGLGVTKLSIDAGAKLTLVTGAPATGTGSHTIFQQMVAEEFQVPLADVAIVQGNTDTETFGHVGGSGVTLTIGNAVMAATAELKAALAALAAQVMGRAAEDVRFDAGGFVSADGESLSLSQLMAQAGAFEELPLTRVGNATTRGPSEVTSFCAQAAEVEVDTETGQVTVRKFVTAHDVGTVINPLTHQGQIEGGLVQGLGQAVTERLAAEYGGVTALNLGDYKLPTIADIPELQTVLIESKTGPAPYASKAIGELSNVAVPAAIANAVFAAAGVRLTELPVTAEKVYAALRARTQAAP